MVLINLLINLLLKGNRIIIKRCLPEGWSFSLAFRVLLALPTSQITLPFRDFQFRLKREKTWSFPTPPQGSWVTDQQEKSLANVSSQSFYTQRNEGQRPQETASVCSLLSRIWELCRNSPGAEHLLLSHCDKGKGISQRTFWREQGASNRLEEKEEARNQPCRLWWDFLALFQPWAEWRTGRPEEWPPQSYIWDSKSKSCDPFS